MMLLDLLMAIYSDDLPLLMFVDTCSSFMSATTYSALVGRMALGFMMPKMLVPVALKGPRPKYFRTGPAKGA